MGLLTLSMMSHLFLPGLNVPVSFPNIDLSSFGFSPFRLINHMCYEQSQFRMCFILQLPPTFLSLPTSVRRFNQHGSLFFTLHAPLSPPLQTILLFWCYIDKTELITPLTHFRCSPNTLTSLTSFNRLYPHILGTRFKYFIKLWTLHHLVSFLKTTVKKT